MKNALVFVLFLYLSYQQQASATLIPRARFLISKDERKIVKTTLLEDNFVSISCNENGETNCTIAQHSKIFDIANSERKFCSISLKSKINLNNLQLHALNFNYVLFVSPDINLVNLNDCSHKSISETDENDNRMNFIEELSDNVFTIWDKSLLWYRSNDCRELCKVWPNNYWIKDYVSRLSLMNPWRNHFMNFLYGAGDIEGMQLILDSSGKARKVIRKYPEQSQISILSSAHDHLTVIYYPKNITKDSAIISHFKKSGGLKSERNINLWNTTITGLINLPGGGYVLSTKNNDDINNHHITRFSENGDFMSVTNLQELEFCRNKLDEYCSKFYINGEGEYCRSSFTTQDHENFVETLAVGSCVRL